MARKSGDGVRPDGVTVFSTPFPLGSGILSPPSLAPVQLPFQLLLKTKNTLPTLAGSWHTWLASEWGRGQKAVAGLQSWSCLSPLGRVCSHGHDATVKTWTQLGREGKVDSGGEVEQPGLGWVSSS